MVIAHLALPTRDIRKTARFFEATLGWQPIDRPNNIAIPSAWLEIAPGQEVHLLEIPDFAPSPFEREYGRHLAVTYPREGFEPLQNRLRAEGAEVIAAERPTPFARFFFRSPDGYVVEVVEECTEIKPVTMAKPSPRPFGLAAGEFTVPSDFDEPLPEETRKYFHGK